MRFVVTGSGGFVGSHLVYSLLRHTQHNVLAVSSQHQTELWQRILATDTPTLARGPRLEIGSNRELLGAGLLRRGDVVINCAFPWNRDGAEMANGLDYQRHLYHHAADRGARTFVNLSSQSVYPNERDWRASERSPLDLDSPYAVAKYACELMSADILEPAALVNVRLGSLIGRGYRVRIVNRLIERSIAGEDLVIDNGDLRFGFMDVRDACRALTAIGEVGATPEAPVVNVGSTSQVSLHQIAELVAQATADLAGIETRIKVTNTKRGMGGQSRSSLDSSLAEAVYGLSSGRDIRETVEWIASGYLGTDGG